MSSSWINYTSLACKQVWWWQKLARKRPFLPLHHSQTTTSTVRRKSIQCYYDKFAGLFKYCAAIKNIM